MSKNNIFSLAILASSVPLLADTNMVPTSTTSIQKPASPVVAPMPARVEKIVVFSMQHVLGESDEGKESVKTLMSQQQEWEKKLKIRENDIKNKANALQAKMKTAKQEALERDNEELEKLNREYKNMATEANTSLQKAQNKTLMELQKKVRAAVKDLAPKNNWDIVIPEEIGVLHANTIYKIDNEIINYMNAEYKKSKMPQAKPAVSIPATSTK
ncbi:MAG TPA: OmpH family outer membrane protein [Candidatus Babeliales bacterium]|nr:OmpH family outer membrane protein [Candidatus Babeliales bacterium]